jgi:hypothetical protein
VSSIYVCNVVGDGVTPETAYRPSFPSPFSCLFIDQARGKGLIISPDDSATGTGVNRLVQAPTLTALRNKAKTTNPTGAQRTALNTWLTNGGYQPLTTQTTWAECIHFAARQVNPAADLDATA